MTDADPALTTVSPDEAADALLEWWETARPAKKWMHVLDGPSGTALPVLQDLQARVEGSVLLDVTGLTAEEVIWRVTELLGVDPADRENGGWEQKVRWLSERRLVLLAHVHRMGRTRRSCEAERLRNSMLRFTCSAKGLRIVAHLAAPVLLGASDAGFALGGAAAPEPPVRPEPLRALALAEPRVVPLQVWAELMAALGTEGWDEDSLSGFVGETPGWFDVQEEGVAFADEGLAEAIRRETDPGTLAYVNRHMTTWLRTLGPRLHHPAGWQAGGPLGAYAAAALAMHAAQADHEAPGSTGLFEDVIADGALAANISQVPMMDAAHCASQGSVGGNSAAADAMYLWLYDVAPSAQAEWASWLHLMAFARGDRTFAAAVEHSGVRLPWTARWTNWRPPGGYHLDFLQAGTVEALVEVRWQGRKAVASVGGDRHSDVKVWDAMTGASVAGPWPGGKRIPEEHRSDLTWPEPGTGGPENARDVWDRLPETDDPEFRFLDGSMLPLGDLSLLGGSGGVLAISFTEGITALEPPRNRPSIPYATAGAITPVGASVPGPQDLRALFGPDVFHAIDADDLPDGVTHHETRRLLLELGVPELSESGLSIEPDWEWFLSSLSWTEEVERPDTEGPFFCLGRWTGGVLVVDGITGHVLRMPFNPEESDLDGVLVASGLSAFFTMAGLWFTGVRTHSTIAEDEEKFLLRDHVAAALRTVDDHGAGAGAWSFVFGLDE
ncbi:SUKH-4 family immunity protein [Streptomyces sp. NPDC050738]|uniref:SUKH-4 family immunity protein n=1 Tax=Streptomyces sp. NPDC050738 TaxID=3154744 RepID=UPI003426D79C